MFCYLLILLYHMLFLSYDSLSYDFVSYDVLSFDVVSFVLYHHNFII